MALRPILRMGHPVLRQVARPVPKEEITSPKMKGLVRDMFHTMRHVGGIGLAAPQIGESVQVVVIDVPEMPESPPVPAMAMFNPRMEFLLKHEAIEMWESCLSVPTMTGRVRRFNNVLVHYDDADGVRRRLGATGFLAGVFQHELEHLEGKLFVDSIISSGNLFFEEEWEAYHAGAPGICETGSIRFFER